MKPHETIEMAVASETFSSRELLEEMISSIREGVVVIGKDGRIFAANPAAKHLLARGGEIESQPMSELIHDEAVLAAFRTAIDSGESTETKFEVALRNDNRVFDLRAAPLSFAERKEQNLAIGIFYDITRLERLERVRQEFLSNVSHELRTPLTSILAFVETLDDGALEDKDNNRRFLGVIRRNAERMHHLIDDVLELSLIEAGKVSVEPKTVQLATFVDDTWTALNEKAQERGVTFENKVAKGISVQADPRRLEQILINLLSNAVKFNREGGMVSVSHIKDAEGDRIIVKDNGDGISPEHLPRIFERFYRTDTARSRELGGTGLGLAIVKHLVRLHHGEISVSSTVGEGSEFTIVLPQNIS